MQMHEIQQLARDTARALAADGNRVVDASTILGCSGGCDCCEQIDELAEGEVERIIFDVLDRALYTP